MGRTLAQKVMITGWWLGHPPEKCDFVNWDDNRNPIYLGKSKMATKPPTRISWDTTTTQLCFHNPLVSGTEAPKVKISHIGFPGLKIDATKILAGKSPQLAMEIFPKEQQILETCSCLRCLITGKGTRFGLVNYVGIVFLARNINAKNSQSNCCYQIR